VHEDRVRWDERYAGRTTSNAEAPEHLGDRPELLAGGRALDIACGPGAQTLWLAERGWDVIALDVSPVAIGLLRRAATDAGVADRVDARIVDLDRGLPTELGRFDVIVCQRYRQPSLYGAIVDHLADGGVAAVTVLSEVGLDGAGGPFHAAPGELVEAFDRPDVEVVDHVEADGTASVVLRRCATIPSA